MREISDAKRAQVILLGELIKKTGCTIRDAGIQTDIPKSTAYEYVTLALPVVNSVLGEEVRQILAENKKKRSIYYNMLRKKTRW